MWLLSSNHLIKCYCSTYMEVLLHMHSTSNFQYLKRYRIPPLNLYSSNGHFLIQRCGNYAHHLSIAVTLDKLLTTTFVWAQKLYFLSGSLRTKRFKLLSQASGKLVLMQDLNVWACILGWKVCNILHLFQEHKYHDRKPIWLTISKSKKLQM